MPSPFRSRRSASAEKARWHYAKRYWYAPDRSLDAILTGNRRYYRYKKRIEWCLTQLGFDLKKVEIVPVEHHLAHASSAYHCSGFTEKTAILGIDGKGEYATTFFGYGENGKIHKIKEFYDPDSLGGLYGALTEYLGFEMLDGEYKVMGMAPYGDPTKYDFSRLAKFENGELIVNTDYANVIGFRRYKEKENGKNRGYYFSPKLIDWLGPMRHGDIADDPYIHYAASMQKLFEDLSLQMIEYYLGDILKETGKLAFSGGGALNVKLNQKIIARPDLKELFVQPASGDAGTAIGAASYVSVQRGVPVEKMEHVYLGPAYSNEDVIAACARHPSKPQWRKIDNVPQHIAKVLTDGNPVAWFQGRMEFGPRALGGRSILGCPSAAGVADRINEQIKFRERWRPFCPSMLDTVGPQMLGSDHPAPFMTFTFEVAEAGRSASRSRARRRHLARAGAQARVQPALLRPDAGTGKTHRQRRRAQHLAQPPRRTDDLLADRCAEHVLRLGSGVSDHGRCAGGQGFGEGSLRTWPNAGSCSSAIRTTAPSPTSRDSTQCCSKVRRTRCSPSI